MKIVLSVIAVWLLTTASYGQSAEAQDKKVGVAAYDDFREPYKTQCIRAWKQQLDFLKRSLVQNRKLVAQHLTANDKRVVDSKNAEIKRFERNDPPFMPSIDIDSFHVGDYGNTPYNMKVVQVISDKKMITSIGHDHWFMLEGFSTDGITDDSFIGSRMVKITGTTTYPTAIGGTKTVPLLNPLDINSLKMPAEERVAQQKKEQQQAEAKQQAEKDREKAIEEAKWRTWTDASGEHKIEAKYSGMVSGTVKLTKRDGSTLKVPLENLSDDDKAWIENRSKSK